MHLWSPSGLMEDEVSPSMDAMMTMSTYYYKQASLIEGGSNATSWRQARAALMSEAGTISAACPAGLQLSKTAKPFHRPPKHEDALFQIDEHGTSTGVRSSMKKWCDTVQGNRGKCGIGLITYGQFGGGLGNAHLKCNDMLQVASAGREQGLGSIWLWSGGIIPRMWEAGLKQFVMNSDEPCKDSYPLASSFASYPLQDECGCKFDGNYCCTGRKRPGVV
jgi:hypothetical protein